MVFDDFWRIFLRILEPAFAATSRLVLILASNSLAGSSFGSCGGGPRPSANVVTRRTDVTRNLQVVPHQSNLYNTHTNEFVRMKNLLLDAAHKPGHPDQLWTPVVSRKEQIAVANRCFGRFGVRQIDNIGSPQGQQTEVALH
jgi:hypothetical protein